MWNGWTSKPAVLLLSFEIAGITWTFQLHRNWALPCRFA